MNTNINDNYLWLKSNIFLPINNKAWCASIHDNAYFTIDINSGDVDIKGFFYDEEIRWGLYMSAIQYNNEIYWIPYYANEIAVYNLEINELKKIRINGIEKYGSRAKFGSAILYKNRIYAMGRCMPVILEINCDNKEVKCIYISDIVNNTSDVFYHDAYVQDNNLLYIPLFHSSAIIEIDMDTNKYRKISIIENEYNGGYTQIIKKGNVFYLYDGCDQIIKWREDEGIVSVVRNHILEGYANKYYKSVICTKEKEIRFAAPAAIIAIQQESSKDNIIIDLKEKFDQKTWKADLLHFLFVRKIGNYIWFQLYYDRNDYNKIFTLNLQDLTVKDITLNVNPSKIQTFSHDKMGYYMHRGTTIQESNCMGQSLLEFARLL